jgi:2-keto-4-pentenoate hydratase/2-oxohepta-3-ene-1,7-dioic acid hydratase in catechol pathway
MPDECGGQFFYAKAFDSFAPIGPVLVSPEELEKQKAVNNGVVRLTTKVNGKILQDTDTTTGLYFGVNEILSSMSQDTTIPAGTVVMTGTPAGVGVFQTPEKLLKNGDVFEVEIGGIGVLRNVMSFI